MGSFFEFFFRHLPIHFQELISDFRKTPIKALPSLINQLTEFERKKFSEKMCKVSLTPMNTVLVCTFGMGSSSKVHFKHIPIDFQALLKS